jgi:hypothetical protein
MGSIQLDEPEATRLAGFAVEDDLARPCRDGGLRQDCHELLVGIDIPGQVAHEHSVSTHLFFSLLRSLVLVFVDESGFQALLPP